MATLRFVFRAAVIETLGFAVLVWTLSGSLGNPLDRIAAAFGSTAANEANNSVIPGRQTQVATPRRSDEQVERTLESAGHSLRDAASHVVDRTIDDLFAQIKR